MALVTPAGAAVASGAYQTLPGAVVEEWGDAVTNGIRTVPLFATLRFDLSATQNSLIAVLTNAVLEGGAPFPLTVRSSSGLQLANGSYSFMGDYLQNIYPGGTQYGFDWTFSTSTNGEVVWNGTIAWWGGHAWYVTISNLTVVPIPWLEIAQTASGSVQLMWSTNFADYILEYAIHLTNDGWSTVTNVPTTKDDCLSITTDTSGVQRFYRLRKP